MATEFDGDIQLLREHARRALERDLNLKSSSWSTLEKVAFENFAMLLLPLGEVRNWREEEKQDLVRVIRAKANPDEMHYLHLTQQHKRLRIALLKAGNPPKDQNGVSR